MSWILCNASLISLIITSGSTAPSCRDLSYKVDDIRRKFVIQTFTHLIKQLKNYRLGIDYDSTGLKPLLWQDSGVDDDTVRSPDWVTYSPQWQADRSRLANSLVQVGDDIFEDLVILLGETAQNVLHRLEALFPIVDLWILGEREKGLEEGVKWAKGKIRRGGGVRGKDLGGGESTEWWGGMWHKRRGGFKKPGESNWIQLFMKDSVIFSDHSVSSTPSSNQKKTTTTHKRFEMTS